MMDVMASFFNRMGMRAHCVIIDVSSSSAKAGDQVREEMLADSPNLRTDGVPVEICWAEQRLIERLYPLRCF